MDKLEKMVYCGNCKGERQQQILKTYSQQSSPEDDFQWHQHNHIIQCLGCNYVSFLLQYGDEDDWNHADQDGDWERLTVYPEQIKEKEINIFEIVPQLFRHAPIPIKNLYDQIIDVHNMGHLFLATVGLRALIEAICLDVKITDGTLYNDSKNKKLTKKGEDRISSSLEGKIFGLYEKEFIIWEHSLILQKIRDIGNAAAHEIKAPDIYDFRSAFQIVEQVLNNVYELKVHKFLTEKND